MGEEIEKSIRNLKQYIKEDPYFNRTSKIETDFDKFCYNHCKDIENLLEENKMQRKQLNDAFNNGWIHKSKVRAEFEEIDEYLKNPDDNFKNITYTIEEVFKLMQQMLLRLLQEGDDK